MLISIFLKERHLHENEKPHSDIPDGPFYFMLAVLPGKFGLQTPPKTIDTLSSKINDTVSTKINDTTVTNIVPEIDNAKTDSFLVNLLETISSIL